MENQLTPSDQSDLRHDQHCDEFFTKSFKRKRKRKKKPHECRGMKRNSRDYHEHLNQQWRRTKSSGLSVWDCWHKHQRSFLRPGEWKQRKYDKFLPSQFGTSNESTGSWQRLGNALALKAERAINKSDRRWWTSYHQEQHDRTAERDAENPAL